MTAETVTPRPVVLIVHRDAARWSALAELREELAVVEAEDLRHVHDKIALHGVDLVLLELGGQSELEGCRRLKEAHAEPFLPVLFFGWNGSEEERRAAEDAGADDLLVLPMTSSALRLRLRPFLKVRAQSKEVHAQLAEIRRLDASKDDLLALIAHDLRNPIAGLAVLLHALQRDAKDELQRNDLGAAIRATERVRSTMDDLLAVRRLEDGTMSFRRTSFALAKVVREAITAHVDVASGRRVTIEEELEELQASADARLVRRAVENMIATAVRFAREGGVVVVRSRSEDGGHLLEVAEGGPARPYDAARPAFSTLSAGPVRSGPGLGLYLASLVAGMHGGKMTVDTEDGRAVLRLTLPAAATT